ncbi:MAG TPA: SGNH/GDSL hydrolase family protein [Candidatus Gallacutalibacter stercoravium]|nr:SGNH/GDSL hydrolase family protein [Candidatus Gallacutalibacter stercoravium]
MKPFFTKGQTVLFQGDSVTDCDRDRNDPTSLSAGYPGKVAAVYRALFGDGVRFINRGVGGDRTKNLLLRYEEDFRQVKPDFVSILIGINDTWRRYDSGDPTSTQQFAANYRQLLTQLRADFPDIKIMLIEPFLLPTMADKLCWREDLDPKIQEVRALGAEFADYYIPMDGIVNALCITKTYRPEELSADGVHPTDVGHGVLAYQYLKTLEIL